MSLYFDDENRDHQEVYTHYTLEDDAYSSLNCVIDKQGQSMGAFSFQSILSRI